MLFSDEKKALGPGLIIDKPTDRIQTFTDIFIVTNNTATGVLTNFLDLGAATNQSRFYRACLSP